VNKDLKLQAMHVRIYQNCGSTLNESNATSELGNFSDGGRIHSCGIILP